MQSIPEHLHRGLAIAVFAAMGPLLVVVGDKPLVKVGLKSTLKEPVFCLDNGEGFSHRSRRTPLMGSV